MEQIHRPHTNRKKEDDTPVPVVGGKTGSCRHRRPAAGALPQPATEENDHGTEERLGPADQSYIFWLSDSHQHGTVRLLTLRTADLVSSDPGEKVTRLSHLAAPRTAFASATPQGYNSETVSKSDEP